MKYGIMPDMYKREINLKTSIKHKSLFLLGPRQTGKSTLLKKQFPEAKYVDLLEADTFRTLSANPEILRQRLKNTEKIIIIDEIQKLPSILDEVQLLIDRNKDLRFILTGSSARKLRRGNANLLGGRAWFFNLHPLISQEYGIKNLNKIITTGSLPAIIDSDFYKEDLKNYVGTYLKEEIQAEGFSRNIENFSRFLNVAGLCNGQQLNYTKIANDSQVPARTIREYFKVLEDTLIAHQLQSYSKTISRKAVSTSKMYFFDIGVANTLMKRSFIEKGSIEYGSTLEHLIFLELKAYIDYNRLDQTLNYWRSLSQIEVDFIIGDEIAIEVKSKTRISNSDLKGIKAFKDDVNVKKSFVICHEVEERLVDDILIIPVELFLKKLWSGEIF